mgnify:CR=1 FL=1
MDYAESLGLPLARLPLAFVDVETTGLRAGGGDRICEVAVVVCQGKQEIHRYCSLVNPLRPISPAAAAVNGLSDEMVRGAPAFAEVAEQVGAALSLGLPVAHNAPFDLAFLAREFALAGAPAPAAGALDTLGLARRILPFRRHGLTDLARQFAISVPGQAHRALADALATRELLAHLVREAGMSTNASLAEIISLQGGLIPWPDGHTASAPALPRDFAEAFQPGRLVRIDYLDMAGARTCRLVEPIETYVNGGALYLVAFCHLRQSQRTFRIDRIIAWEPA